MKKKDVIAFIGIISYILIVFGGINLYFLSVKNDSLEKLTIRNQNIEIEVMQINKCSS